MDSSAAVPPIPVDEEDSRRRRTTTDCIYYLASPLTCKKGSECEYRHSDAARMNPRDCWYWFNGNCANLKCSFRHPLLDDLLGAPATPRPSQQSALKISVPAQASGSIPASGTAKQGVPCYYFQKGVCAKGDMCAFSHAPQVFGNPLQQTSKGFTPAFQPHPQMKNSWTKSNNSAQQSTIPAVLDKLKVSAYNGKPAQKSNVASRAYHPSGIYPNHNNYYATKSYQPQPSVEDHSAENIAETGEFAREPSAGSSVLVGSAEDDAEQPFKEDSSSYHRVNVEQHTGMRRKTHGGYELERPRRRSAERLLSEGRLSQREHIPVSADSSDLRHRLLKQRKLNNPRSTQDPDIHDRYREDERNNHRRRQEEHATHDVLLHSRLRGRINIAGETSFDRLGPHPEKERGLRGRLSPPRQTDLRGKLHDRLKGRSNEDVPAINVKSSVVKANSVADTGSLNFSSPKSLAELRANKVAYSSGEHNIKCASPIEGTFHMTSEIVVSRGSPDAIPFDGPKPLSVILKRKRESACGNSSIIGDEDEAAGEEEEAQNKSEIPEIRDIVGRNKEDSKEEALHPEDDEIYDGDGDEYMSPTDHNPTEAAGIEGVEEEEQQDLETGEEYEYDDNVNGDDGNEYQEYDEDDDLDNDDGDDFARKVGVLIS